MRSLPTLTSPADALATTGVEAGRRRPALAIAIRAAQPGEFDRLAALLLAAWERGIAPLVPGLARRRVMTVVPVRSFLRAQAEALLVAEIGGQPVGVAAAGRGRDYISDLGVEPRHEGRGVGSALLAALECRIALAGHGAARLQVLSANVRALALYRYRGYRPRWQGLKRDRGLGVELHMTGMAKPLRMPTRR